MNTSGNQRAKQTKEKIRDAYFELLREKEPAHITVSEICERARIHRTTFYGHYLDTEDMRQKLLQDMYGRIMDAFLEENAGMRTDGFIRFFELIRENREFFEAYLNAGGQLSPAHTDLPTPLAERMDELVGVQGYASREELLYHQTFFTAGLSAVILRWLRGGCAESPKELGRMLDREYTPNRALFGQNPGD